MEKDHPRILTTAEDMSSCLKDFIEGKIELNRRENFQFTYKAANLENLRMIQYYHDAKEKNRKKKKTKNKTSYKETDSVSCLDAPDVDMETINNLRDDKNQLNKILTQISTNSNLDRFTKKSRRSRSRFSPSNQLDRASNGLWQYWTAKNRSKWLQVEEKTEKKYRKFESERDNDQEELYRIFSQELETENKKRLAKSKPALIMKESKRSFLSLLSRKTMNKK